MDFEAELKNCMDMPRVMITDLRGRWLRSSLECCAGKRSKGTFN
jgi:hypothetical protein